MDHAEIIALAERVLGPGLQQQQLANRRTIAEAVGTIAPTACPMAKLYGIMALDCNRLNDEGRAVLVAYGIAMADYESFLELNDSTDEEAHATLRDWILGSY